jgi:hypothetical protein
MKILGFPIEIDWRQRSTIRGVVWFGFGIMATIAVFLGNIPGALALMTIAGTVAGGIGVAIKD